MTIQEDSLSLNPGQYVELFDVDLSVIGGAVQRFYDGTNAADSLGRILWRGNNYLPMPIKSEGWETSIDGKPPHPRLSISNIGNLIGSLVATHNDFVGAEVTRWRTFKQFLDGESQADPNQHYPADIFFVNRKLSQTSEVVVFELSTPFDQTSKQLPGRAVQKRYCPWRYRSYDPVAGDFDYAFSECPYTGSDYFTKTGQVVSDAESDQCGKRLSDCNLRFPAQPLPFGGFPGLGRR